MRLSTSYCYRNLSLESIVKTVLRSMSNVNKPQRTFIAALLTTLIVFQGKATYRNMNRYSDMSEKRFSRWYSRAFDFALFNQRIIAHALPKNDRIAAIDASFISKSGKLTEGLGWFYNGSACQSQHGLEASLISLIDLKLNTAFALDARQTLDQSHKTRVEVYAEQVVEIAPQLQEQGVSYLVGDAYYSKEKFVSPIIKAGLKLVGKLRADADLQWFYEGEYCGIGRPKKFDGKVRFEKDLHRFEHVGRLQEGIEIYTKKVYSKTFKCAINVVMLRQTRENKTSRVLLYSTDTELDALVIIKYYKARFQIEFLFRDAKQYTGFTHCQSRKKEATHTHLNASLSALNVLKLEDQLLKGSNDRTVISIASWKRKKFNQHLLDFGHYWIHLTAKNKLLETTG
ncbi:IS4 family transposase [Zooshikella ganghwensis]|uniref:IS4 family transposase n=1 Tax=Zooshikella ganghwensis TaxID=202772 RepID=A0A4P9VM15_9GAMM|nr:IS4 family transposase [Zooshikella ganghwensis]